MYTAHGTNFLDTAVVLDSTYDRCLNVRELETHVQHVAQELKVARPSGRTREDYLGWLDQHSPRALEVIRALISGAAGTRTAQ
jgi:hypothetical protein